MYNLYFLDVFKFANDFERVVHGGRGSYVELKRDQIDVELLSKFKQPLPLEITDELFYYYWLVPKGRNEKIYWQCRKVKYADYKIGFYYISPELLLPFSENKAKPLFK